MTNDEWWNRFAQSFLIDRIHYSMFDVGRSMFDVHKFLFFDQTGRSRPEAALTP